MYRYQFATRTSTPSTLSSFCRIPLFTGKLKIELTKNPLHYAGKSGEHSWGENLHHAGGNGEHSSGENSHGNNTKRHIKSHYTWQCFKHPCSHDDNQHMDTSHGSSLSGVDWGNLKKRTPKYGPSLMELDWGGEIKASHTSECMLSEVDWGAHETHTSGCMLSEVD